MFSSTRLFEHELLDLPSIESVDTDNGRFYTTPNGDRYQSVTTFLGKISDNKWLEEWKERVGEDEVNKRSTQAKRRGTAVHAILEQYLLNNKQYARGHMPNNLMMFESMRKKLDVHLGTIRGIELGLWSDKMKMAGRCDMLASWNEVTSIVDFKTSAWPKSEEKILSYFYQTTIYAMMVEELTGFVVPQLVVLIGVDNEDAQVFVKSSYEYRQDIIDFLLSVS